MGIFFAGLPFSAGFQFLYPKDTTFTETGDSIPNSGAQLNHANDSYFSYNVGVIRILMWAQMSLFSLGHVHFMVWRYASSTRKSRPDPQRAPGGAGRSHPGVCGL